MAGQARGQAQRPVQLAGRYHEIEAAAQVAALVAIVGDLHGADRAALRRVGVDRLVLAQAIPTRDFQRPGDVGDGAQQARAHIHAHPCGFECDQLHGVVGAAVGCIGQVFVCAVVLDGLGDFDAAHARGPQAIAVDEGFLPCAVEAGG
ncbi:hypothetical protein D3C71_1655550 [compost metagenome]